MNKDFPVIIWDIDDVLNDLMRSWLERFWKLRNPDCTTLYREITENPPHVILGIDLDDYLSSLDKFRLSGDYQKLIPNRQISSWFQKHGHKFRHIALTTPPLISAGVSADWVIRHFGRWIRNFSFIPANRKGEVLPLYDKSKGEFLAWWGKADVLIDDNTANVEDAKAIGIKTILIAQPWNGGKLTVKQNLDLLM